MNDKLDQYRRLLLTRRDVLQGVAESGREAAATVELDQARVGRLSRMDALQQQAMAQATDQRRAQDLGRIEAALVRIQAGDYGPCRTCGEQIAAARLRVDPAALLCIECAEQAGR